MKTLWFRRKSYGWGWYPATWQGWVILLMFIGLLVANALVLVQNQEPTSSALTWFFIREAMLVLGVLAICYKTGEKPKWKWGKQETTIQRRHRSDYDWTSKL